MTIYALQKLTNEEFDKLPTDKDHEDPRGIPHYFTVYQGNGEIRIYPNLEADKTITMLHIGIREKD